MQLSPSDPDIQTIVARIANGDLDLQPDFQRGEVWSVQKKRRLIDSILRNWYIPPIHTVVVPGSNKQDVLDGQQRLVAIRDFVNGDYAVDGSIQPIDYTINRLHGLRYSELPVDAVRLFNAFTIRIMRVTDYRPEEPGELFFRLNAITNVTAAEQRNAFYGPVRQQVKTLVAYFEELGNSAQSLGFSNSRMAYDDVLSKFLCTIEKRTLAVKLTANVVSDRFRTDAPFDKSVIKFANEAIESFSFLRETAGITKFNKATLLSWLIFCFAYSLHGKSNILHVNGSFLRTFDEIRQTQYAAVNADGKLQIRSRLPRQWRSSLSIYADRSTSRVLDISSVVLRDFIIHLSFFIINDVKLHDLPFSAEKIDIIQHISTAWQHNADQLSERYFESIVTPSAWGLLA